LYFTKYLGVMFTPLIVNLVAYNTTIKVENCSISNVRALYDMGDDLLYVTSMNNGRMVMRGRGERKKGVEER
jgi:hypothetical protein